MLFFNSGGSSSKKKCPQSSAPKERGTEPQSNIPKEFASANGRYDVLMPPTRRVSRRGKEENTDRGRLFESCLPRLVKEKKRLANSCTMSLDKIGGNMS